MTNLGWFIEADLNLVKLLSFETNVGASFFKEKRLIKMTP